MFNEYVWQLYLKAGGENVVRVFKDNLTETFSESYPRFIANLQKVYCPSSSLTSSTAQELLDLCNDLHDGLSLVPKEECDTRQQAMVLFRSWLRDGEQLSDKDIFEYFSSSVSYFTTFLSIVFPSLFVPYYFLFNFNVLEKIADNFDIVFPQIPVKKDYKGRLDYYEAICGALLDFADRQNMSHYELYAFLYDFAPQYIGGADSYIIKNLPEAKSAFFVGGSESDIFYSENPDAVTPWQCSPDTLAGDMIVMYLKSPVSAVNSVWRSVSIGFNDPFFFYYRCTYIGNPVVIKKISQKRLQRDEIFKSVPIVRKNMQGINGVELKPSEYNHLMDMAGATGIPRLQFTLTDEGTDLTNEKDVENKLIKPLISKLGYSDGEYVQQLYIEIGNHNHALIPDFALLPVTERGHQSAFALIEAKYAITNSKAMDEVRIQARSYARQLNVRYSAIASKDKVWVYVPDDDFTKEVFESTWSGLNDADVFSQLFKLIGKDVKFFHGKR